VHNFSSISSWVRELWYLEFPCFLYIAMMTLTTVSSTVLYCAVCVCVCWCTEASHTERSTFLSSCYTVQYVCVCVGVQRHHTQKDQHSCRRAILCSVCVCVCWCTEASHTERSTFLSSLSSDILCCQRTQSTRDSPSLSTQNCRVHRRH